MKQQFPSIFNNYNEASGAMALPTDSPSKTGLKSKIDQMWRSKITPEEANTLNNSKYSFQAIVYLSKSSGKYKKRVLQLSETHLILRKKKDSTKISRVMDLSLLVSFKSEQVKKCFDELLSLGEFETNTEQFQDNLSTSMELAENSIDLDQVSMIPAYSNKSYSKLPTGEFFNQLPTPLLGHMASKTSQSTVRSEGKGKYPIFLIKGARFTKIFMRSKSDLTKFKKKLSQVCINNNFSQDYIQVITPFGNTYQPTSTGISAEICKCKYSPGRTLCYQSFEKPDLDSEAEEQGKSKSLLAQEILKFVDFVKFSKHTQFHSICEESHKVRVVFSAITQE
jgi:hypothetical protein